MSNVSCSQGASTTIPMNPSTMEGKKPSSSSTGFSSSRTGPGATSETKTAISRLNGSASSEEAAVTASVPTIRGNIPSTGGFSAGYHRSPKNRSLSVTAFSTGIPSLNRK
jgi:hypothetical protein